jgi:hypothetical protein
MITTDYVITAVEQIEGEDEYYLHLTRRFGPLKYETIKDLNIGDEMSIQVTFPGDLGPDIELDNPVPSPEQMPLFPVETDDNASTAAD